MITLEQALTRAAGQLAAHPDLRHDAFRDAVSLLMHLLEISRATLIAHPERTLDREQQAAYQRLVERRLTFEPMQYILGETEFFGLTLRVNPDVLIPRPETELLVEHVLTSAAQAQSDNLRILDVGTGSGAIALALAQNLPSATLTAVDLSPQALATARQNAASLGLADRVRFLQSDLLNAVAAETFDIIVSNPPYIPTTDAVTLHPQVRDFEPSLALFAGETGLDLYARLIPQALTALTPGGLLALEIGHGQETKIRQLLTGWQHIRFIPDLQHIPRVVLAQRP